MIGKIKTYLKLGNKKKVIYIICGLLGIIIAALLISYLSTVGIFKLICICFGWEFSWALATGIWLVLMLVSAFAKTNIKLN